MNGREGRVFENASALAEGVAHDLTDAVSVAARGGRRFSLALSGGSTPKLLYALLAQEPWRSRMLWAALDLFWGDERCVPPTHPDSNYGMTKAALLDHVPLGDAHIHRVRGEAAPADEYRRYEDVIRATVSARHGALPRFDWILLGMGDDGHTASVFPGQPLAPVGDLCGVAHHPQNGGQRISITLDLINAAARVTFLVTGAAKASLVAAITARAPGSDRYPAGQVNPVDGTLGFYLDSAAARA